MASAEAANVPRTASMAREEAYDVVVIGAGASGLTAAALLADAGKHVLVVEAGAQPGGHARALSDGAYTFDRAVHLITSCEPDGPFGQGVIDAVLRQLGVRDRCEFLRVDDPFYTVRLPGFSLDVPGGHEPFVEAHARAFPAEARGIRRLAELQSEAYRELVRSPIQPRLSDLGLMPLRARELFRYRNATLRQVVDSELTDPRLRAVYTSLWGWIGAPPSHASFLTWAAMMGTYVDDGAYYCRGSFQRLVDALVAGLERAAGELVVGTRAERILAEDRRVTGVVLDSGQRIAAPAVIAAIDARSTFEELLGADRLPTRYLRRLRSLELSPSVVAIYVATNLDARALGANVETEIARAWDPERVYADGLGGRIAGVGVVIPSLADPSLAPPGEHVVTVMGLGARESGETRHDERRVADQLLDLAEDVLPGLRAHLTFVEPADGPGGATHPRVHRIGPVYGWIASPTQTGPRRLPHTTPVTGLLLAGQWTRPAHGILWVMESGIQAARVALGAPTAAPPLPLPLPLPA